MIANIITIGDEILIGQTVDTNSAWMGTKLNQAGIKINEILSVSDKVAHITDALNRSLQTADLVLITGGLGPTKDDVTKKTLADYFGSELVLNEAIWSDIKSYLNKRGRPIPESVKYMAMLPDKATVLRNRRGTAAAMWFEQKGKIIVSMPGVPHEMKEFVAVDIIPRLQQRFKLPVIIHKILKSCGIGEAVVAEKIKHIEENLPMHISLAYLPSYGILKLRLSGRGADYQILEQEIEAYRQQIRAILYPKYAFGYDTDDLTAIIGNLLMEKNAVMGTAESCTGGSIAQRITAISGCSRYYKGGVVAYSNELKQSLLGVKTSTLQEYGAVSEQTVREMAEGVIERLQCDYSVVTSGIAGPTGGTPEKPVGLVWVAVASKEKTVAVKYQFARTRNFNIAISANMALNELRRLIMGII